MTFEPDRPVQPCDVAVWNHTNVRFQPISRHIREESNARVSFSNAEQERSGFKGKLECRTHRASCLSGLLQQCTTHCSVSAMTQKVFEYSLHTSVWYFSIFSFLNVFVMFSQKFLPLRAFNTHEDKITFSCLTSVSHSPFLLTTKVLSFATRPSRNIHCISLSFFHGLFYAVPRVCEKLG